MGDSPSFETQLDFTHVAPAPAAGLLGDIAAADLLPGLLEGSPDDLDIQPEFFEGYYKMFPPELYKKLQALGKELEVHRGTSAKFDSRTFSHPLRQQVYDFIQGLNSQQPEVQVLLLHELPAAQPKWDVMAGFLPFLLRPPQPNAAMGVAPPAAAAGGGDSSDAASSGATGPVAAAAAGAGSSSRSSAGSRQRISKVDPSAGQQPRNFNSYSANKPLPISGNANEPRHVLFITAQCKNQQQQIGTYRGFVCVVKADQEHRPGGDNGHDWRKLVFKGEKQELWGGWLDVSVGLGILEPVQQPAEPDQSRAKRQRSRSRSLSVTSPQMLSPRSSLQGLQLPHQSSAAAAAAAGVAGGGGGSAVLFAAAAAEAAAAAAIATAEEVGALVNQALPLDVMGFHSAAAAGNVFNPHFAGFAIQAGAVQGMPAVTGGAAAVGGGIGLIFQQQQQQGPLPTPNNMMQQNPDQAVAMLQPPLPLANMQWVQQQQQQQQQQQSTAATHFVPISAFGATPAAIHSGLPALSMSQPAAPNVPAQLNMPQPDPDQAMPMVQVAPNAQWTQQLNRRLQLQSTAGAHLIPAAMPGRLPALSMSEPAAPSLAAPAAAAAAGASTAAAAADELASRLNRLEVNLQYKRCASKLLSACRSGQDLLQMMAQEGGAAQQQQRQQQWEALVQLLRGCSVVDGYERNLLHLVATHSFKAPHEQRLCQLELLLDIDQQLGGQLSRAGNNNGSTPLIVAASGIKGPTDVQVFRTLLYAADAEVLATPSTSGWTLLHCLANEAAKAQTAGTRPGHIQLLKTLMRDVVQAVYNVQQASKDEEVSSRFERLCLHSTEPQSRHYQGQHVMKQLWADLQARVPPN